MWCVYWMGGMLKLRSNFYPVEAPWACVVYPGADWFLEQVPHPTNAVLLFRLLQSWLREQGEAGVDWATDGITPYSYRFYFRDPELATVFCIAHGI